MDIVACETSVLEGEKVPQAVNKYTAQATSAPKVIFMMVKARQVCLAIPYGIENKLETRPKGDKLVDQLRTTRCLLADREEAIIELHLPATNEAAARHIAKHLTAKCPKQQCRNSRGKSPGARYVTFLLTMP